MGVGDSQAYNGEGYASAEEIVLVVRVGSVKNKIPLVMFGGAAKISTLIVYDWLYEMLDSMLERFGEKSGRWQEMNTEHDQVFINSGTHVELMLDFPGNKVRSID
jgi:hypothetical protein